MTGIGALAAAIPVPEAGAYPSRRDVPAGRVPPPAAPPGGAAQRTYLFHDEFDGPAGSAPDPAKWTVVPEAQVPLPYHSRMSISP